MASWRELGGTVNDTRFENGISHAKSITRAPTQRSESVELTFGSPSVATAGSTLTANKNKLNANKPRFIFAVCVSAGRRREGTGVPRRQ